MGNNLNSTSSAGGRYFQTNSVNHGKMRSRERRAADISNFISMFDIADRAMPFVGFLGGLFGGMFSSSTPSYGAVSTDSFRTSNDFTVSSRTFNRDVVITDSARNKAWQSSCNDGRCLLRS